MGAGEMSTGSFFDESREQSRIKTRIVSKYFFAWARVIVPLVKSRGGKRVAFIDLFAGPGRYKDDVPSTPLRVLGSAAKDPTLRNMLVGIFNDAHTPHARSLEEAIDSTPEFGLLKFKPRVGNYQVGPEVVERFEGIEMVPTLLFVDPWGYKGLSLRLINSVLRHWGSDCIIFFNYNRINSGLNNPTVKEHMDALFGVERARKLRARLEHERLKPLGRERVILKEIADAFREKGGEFFLPFRFWKEDQKRISHHLLFVSKNFRGYHLMKEIMAPESSSADQGVPSFEYNPRDYSMLSELELDRPLDRLEGQLLEDLNGRTLTMDKIYEVHSVGKPFIKKNYKQALQSLHTRGAIGAEPKPRKGTFADHILVSFPAIPS
jgi:three-Cys-motif partner protein